MSTREPNFRKASEDMPDAPHLSPYFAPEVLSENGELLAEIKGLRDDLRKLATRELMRDYLTLTRVDTSL